MRKQLINKTKYELLAPAGSFDALKAAVSAGCDAVYVGGNMFGARAFANNFSNEELIEAIDYCHLYGKQLYLTVNTLLKNKEIDENLYSYIKPLYEGGLDAVIVQDLGVLKFIKTNFPNLDIHASTQMTVLGSEFADELRKLGVSRVVTPRELSLKEINNIYEKTGLEIETFVHGALCYCYSGQCLLSSLIGARSGNRGKCAQPCRLPYSVNDSKREYYLSPKDLCALNILPDLLENGVFSLKIEGRMKNPEYVATVTSIYRKYIDMYEKYGRVGYKVATEDLDRLLDIYNRGGFTDGFFYKQNSKDIIYTKRPNHMGVLAGTINSVKNDTIYFKSQIKLNKNDVLEIKLKNNEYISFNLGADYEAGKDCIGYLYKKNVRNINDLGDTSIYRTKNNAWSQCIQEKYLSNDILDNKLKINAEMMLQKDKPIVLKLSYNGLEVEYVSEIPSKALNKAVDKETVLKQLNKTGNEHFAFENIDISLDDGLFIPMGQLNNIRREGLALFEKAYLNAFKRQEVNNDVTIEKICYEINENIEFSASVYNIEQLNIVLEYDEISNVYVEQAFNSYDTLNSMCSMIHNSGKKAILSLAHITRDKFDSDFINNKSFYQENNFDGFMFRNIETYFLLKNNKISMKKVVFDSNIYTFNNYSYDYYKSIGADILTASYEHNINELKDMNKYNLEINAYGHIPVMLSANCVQKTAGKCNKDNINSNAYIVLKDRMNAKFKVINNCRYCYNIIYSDIPLCAIDEMSTLIENDIKNFRLNFTIEDSNETKSVLDGFIKNKVPLNIDYTKGHLKRGV
ncbi:MAG: U32 family peptidase [Lachnospiraceae bacterium]|nr:U32 family peptidase [Lachnospiraceae bacterium]